MFKPFRITDNFHSRVESTYVANVALNAGAIVDLDTANDAAITSSVGYGSLTMGQVKLASITTSLGTKELGFAIAAVISGGMPLVERVLGIANNYFTIPEGMNCAIYKPVSGDVIGTTEFVGNLAGDNGAAGLINLSTTGNLAAECGIYLGRYRLVQSGDAARARYVGQSTANGVAVGLFEIL